MWRRAFVSLLERPDIATLPRTDLDIFWLQKRGMARGRNYYIKGASNKQDISEETRELIKNARDPEDYSWKLGEGVQEPLQMEVASPERKRALTYILKHHGDMINKGEETVKYYPHKGEEIPEVHPSPVLMVKRVKTLYGEPYFNKNYCEQIGLGKMENMSKISFLPNVPSVSMLLFKIKHLLLIKPVSFPNGISEEFDPEVDGARFYPTTGEFVIHPSLATNPEMAVKNAEYLKLETKHIVKEARDHWRKPFSSPLGHANYHQDTRWTDNDKADSLYVKAMKKKWT